MTQINVLLIPKCSQSNGVKSVIYVNFHFYREQLITTLKEQVSDLSLYLEEERMNHKDTKRRVRSERMHNNVYHLFKYSNSARVDFAQS